MIPQLLVLKNFLSYQDARLDFRGLHTACVCGANGAGKSSLLVAMTWAIWGKSRVESEEDIVHNGAIQARVDFQFISNQQTYKIIRSRQRGKGSTLDFQVLSGEQFRSLSGKGIKVTQQEIVKTLKLDYDTFINSAYLRQGRADEFMLRGAAERKQILADLLKLDQYELLAERAKDISKNQKAKADFLDDRLAVLKQELGQRQEILKYQKELEQKLQIIQQQQEAEQWQLQQLQISQTQRRSHQEQLRWQEEQLGKLQQERERLATESRTLAKQLTDLADLVNQRNLINRNYQQFLALQKQAQIADSVLQEYQEAKQQQQSLEKQLLTEETQLQRQREQIRLHLQNLDQQEQEIEPILKQESEIKAGLEQLAKARQRLDQLDRLQHQAAPLKQRIYQLQGELERASAQLQAQVEQTQNLVSDLEREIATFPDKRRELQILDEQIRHLKKRAVYHKRVEEKGHERRHFQERLREKQKMCEKQLLEWEAKLNLLQNPEAICPLCEQELAGHYHEQVLAKAQTQHQQLREQIWLLKEQISVCERELQVLRTEYGAIQEELAALEKLQQRYSQLELTLEQGEDLYEQRSLLSAKLKTLSNRLQVQDYAPDVQKELQALEQELQSLNYDEQTHALARTEVEKWRKAEIKQMAWQDAQRKLQQCRQERPPLLRREETLKAQEQELYSNSVLSQNLAQIEAKLDSLNYDPDRHRELNQSRQDYQPWQLRFQELEKAQNQMPQLQARHLQLQSLSGDRLKEQESLEQGLKQLRHQIENYADHSAQIQSLEKSLGQRRQDWDQLLARQGGYEQQLIQLDNLQEEQNEIRQQFQWAKKQYVIYKELAQAFGKNGIQSLMIENILPQLEAQTNLILGRLTGNQLHIQFITQKASKTGSKRKGYKMIDTLEIVIADAQGTRPYETYSGGEAFRINFSIRLALARLLAQRSGTSLQMLIIDEGFGTQDSDGCERLVAAINAIAADFACILTVTHMPQFKEAFQQRIEVYKSNQGSQLNLIT